MSDTLFHTEDAIKLSRKAARAQLRKDVALMRLLGVARWTRGPEDIFLGPPPQVATAPRSIEDEIAHRNRVAEEKHKTLFAATSTRPVLVGAEANRRAEVLKSVVPRQPAQEHDRGKPQAG
jgi:hypothetical protein